jgi:hypothetical protein
MCVQAQGMCFEVDYIVFDEYIKLNVSRNQFHYFIVRPRIVGYEPVCSVAIVTRLQTGQQEYLGAFTDGRDTQIRHCRDSIHGINGLIVKLTI